MWDMLFCVYNKSKIIPVIQPTSQEIILGFVQTSIVKAGIYNQLRENPKKNVLTLNKT